MTTEENSTVSDKPSVPATPAATTVTPGVVYLSRIPPYMKPTKIRHVFSQYGGVGRVYLQPEDPSVRKRRRKQGGNKKQRYTEGWVEFTDKRIAKKVAMVLNNNHVGGKKHGFYHDDLWNIKYLRKFRWTHITEKTAYENAVHRQKLRTEVTQARREANNYLENLEKSKAKSAIIERKKQAGKFEELPSRSVRQRKANKETTKKEATCTVSKSLLKKILS